VFRRRRFFDGRPIARARGGALPDIAWFTPGGHEMAEGDWDSGFGKSVTVFLNGDGITEPDPRGEKVVDDSFLVAFNAHYEDIEVTLPAAYGRNWATVVDTAEGTVTVLSATPGVTAAEPVAYAGGSAVAVAARSLVVLQRLN